MSQKNLEYYNNLNYSIEIKKISPKDGGGYIATIPLLGRHAFVGDGKTVQKALDNLHQVKEMLFENYLAHNISIPEPADEDDKEYSGKFLLRLPLDLHRALAMGADRNATTLNQYCIYLLSHSSAQQTILSEMQSLCNRYNDVFKYVEKMQYAIDQPTWPVALSQENIYDIKCA